MEELLEMNKDLPEINHISVDMPHANVPIKIYEGEFVLKDEANEIKIEGNIIFDWLPNSGAHFYGKPVLETIEQFRSILGLKSYRIIVDGLEFGLGYITNANYGDIDNGAFIKGTLSQQAVFGDRSIPVNKIRFSIPNLRGFHGLVVKNITENSISITNNRLRLEDDNHIITIDKCYVFTERKKSLEEKGGYMILYAGELTCKKGSLTHSDITEILHCLNTFLSFLNGRRTSALFLQGIYEEQVIWCDYTNYFVDPYKAVESWAPTLLFVGFNELWNKFQSIWEDPDDKNFLTSAIHWYVEANGDTGFSEGSIILAQTALELIYNWWIIEQKGMLLGKDTENISASNKIRLLLSQIKIDYKIPVDFKDLQAFLDSTSNIADAPEAIVYIRNAIVHSQEEKRKKLSQIHYKAKYEALQLFIWYIEMSLLCILGFDNQYQNRSSISQADVIVPWAKNQLMK